MILFLCYVFPPAAVLFMGRPFSAIMNCFFTLFGWVPGVKHALIVYADYKLNKMGNKVVRTIDHPAWTRPNKEQSEGRARGRSQKPMPVYFDSPQVGMNGTKFRAKR